MTEHDHNTTGNGWTEYRLLVTAMLERHDEALDGLASAIPAERDHTRELVNACEGRLRDLVDRKFVQLGQMHERQINNAKDEMKQEATDVQVAKITSRWEFWGLIAANITSVIIAVIALLKP